LTQVKNTTPPKRRIAKRSLTTKNITALEFLGNTVKNGYSPFDQSLDNEPIIERHRRKLSGANGRERN